jgi:hypothetical protein
MNYAPQWDFASRLYNFFAKKKKEIVRFGLPFE